MPAKITRNSDGSYRVSTPNGVHAKHTSEANAKKQQRLLNAVDHGWKPGGGGGVKKKRGSVGHAIARHLFGSVVAGQRRGMSVSRAKSGRTARGRVMAAKAGRSK